MVKVEFSYDKKLNDAAVDVSNALSIVKGNLPAEANPAIYTLGDFVLPVDVISLSPKTDQISLGEVRKIAENLIKPYLLSNPGIGNVEVFGGYESSINIEIDPFKAKRYNIDFDKIARVLQTLNRDMPVGFVKSENSYYTITFYGEKDDVERIKQITVLPNVRLRDVAEVSWGYAKRTSGYIGNGKPSVALAIQRAPGGSVLSVSKAAREEMTKLEGKYTNINFEISDTQRDLIELSNENMLAALRDAILFTLLVILFFLSNFRAITVAVITIPMVFFSTMAVIWLTGGSLNITVYAAIIISLGMLTDDAVVVLENIERHQKVLNEDIQTALRLGTKEVIEPIWSGTIASIVVVFPLMFLGGFPQKIFLPLISTLIIALLISFFLSITFIPRLVGILYANGSKKSKIEKGFELLYNKSFGRLVEPYVSILNFSAGKNRMWRRIALTSSVVILLLISMRTIMPIIGRDAMPPMDTGIIKAQLAFSTNETVNSAEIKLRPFLKWLHEQPWTTRSSIALGTEMGVLSMGNGNLPAEATISINCIDRFHRKLDIWQIEELIRDQLSQLEGVKRNDVYDFGATAISTIKASVDVRITSPVVDGLAEKSIEIKEALKDIRGLTSISTSWDKDFSEIVLNIDENKALSYGITPIEIAMQMPLKGQVVGLNGNLQSLNTQVVRLYLKGKFSENEQTLRLLPIHTAMGDVPLEHLATISRNLTFSKIERNKMLYSVDINGYRAKRPVSHLTEEAELALMKVKNNGDFTFTQQGDIVQMNESFKSMSKAMGIGIILLLLVLISIYRSVRMSMIMIMVLPLSMIGATWGMILFHKPMALPSMLGILLLFGIIIKNAVLLIDFYQKYREGGETPFKSAVESVRIRFRPVMMTTFGTIAGMIPIALENAVGLERLSPLADVAIGGLLLGTFLTLIFIPMFAYIVDGEKLEIKATPH
jgi:multidrug efflux pump subunit AcrB